MYHANIQTKYVSLLFFVVYRSSHPSYLLFAISLSFVFLYSQYQGLLFLATFCPVLSTLEISGWLIWVLQPILLLAGELSK